MQRMQLLYKLNAFRLPGLYVAEILHSGFPAYLTLLESLLVVICLEYEARYFSWPSILRYGNISEHAGCGEVLFTCKALFGIHINLDFHSGFMDIIDSASQMDDISKVDWRKKEHAVNASRYIPSP